MGKTLKETDTRIHRDMLISSIAKKGSVWVQAYGASMSPLIKEGDWLEISSISYTKLKPGDVVAIKPEGYQDKSIVHRLIKIINSPNSLLIKGDNQILTNSPEPVSADFLIGKIIAIKRSSKCIRVDNFVWDIIGYIVVKLSTASPGFARIFLLTISLFSAPKEIPSKILKRIKKNCFRSGQIPKKEDLFILQHCSPAPEVNSHAPKALDWEYIYQKSMKTQSVALLYRNLKLKGIENMIPGSMLRRLKDIYITNSLRNLSLLDEFEKIMAVINERKIKAMPIKGFSLLLDIYEDAGARGITDLDLFIDRKDMDAVSGIFQGLGYRRLQEHEKISYYSHHHILTSKEKAIRVVEIHTRLFPWYVEEFFIKIESYDFLARAQKIKWRNIEICKMEKTDEFIFSLLSYYANNFAGLKYLLDADAILKKAIDFDWQGFLKRIKEYDIMTQISYGIFFCKKYLNSPIPSNIIDEISFTSGKTYFVLNRVFPITLMHKQFPKWQSRIMRFKEMNNIRDRSSLIKEAIVWHLYKKFGIFSNYVTQKNYS
ncbi:MAG: nucleotidyltransferase family protein [Candidatus Omnitrophota bacterium]